MLQARELPQVTIPDEFLPLDIDSALYHIEKAAYLGFAKAQTKMGAAYELCQLGCEYNATLSMHYNNLAARQGDCDAEMAISKWFLCGQDGVFKKSEEMAFTYAQRAAQTGLATAEFAMGYYHEVGIYVPVSLKEARVWYGKAADHGNKDAAARIEGITRSKTLSRKDHDNIAVAKINSARASRYGNRPKRLTKPSMPAMPGISRVPAGPYGTVSMPDVGSSFHGYATRGPYSPAAPTSTYTGSPYTNSTNLPPGTLASEAKYPPNQAVTTSVVPTSTRFGVTPPGPVNIQRPLSAMPDPENGRGRGTAAQRLGSTTSMPPTMSEVQGCGRPLEALPPDLIPPRQNYESTQKPLPPIELGFTAPPDFSGADRKKRPQRSNDQGASVSGAGRANMPRPERITSRPPTAAPGYSQNIDGRTASPALAGRPPRNESLPMRPATGPSPLSTPMPGPSSTVSSTPAPSAVSNPGGRRPGKGPSTFEEMGVPQGKKDDDCVSTE